MSSQTKMSLRQNGYLSWQGEIIRFASDNNYCWIHFATGAKIIIAKTLKAVSHSLTDSGFVRVHRSHLVRKDQIHSFTRDHIVLHNGDAIPVARRFKKHVKNNLAIS